MTITTRLKWRLFSSPIPSDSDRRLGCDRVFFCSQLSHLRRCVNESHAPNKDCRNNQRNRAGQSTFDAIASASEPRWAKISSMQERIRSDGGDAADWQAEKRSARPVPGPM